MKHKISALFLAFAFMVGNVGEIHEQLLEKYNYLLPDNLEIRIVDTIEQNCWLPFWASADGCTWWKMVDGKREAIRIDIRKKTKQDTEFVFTHETGHVVKCGSDELCADLYAKTLMKSLSNSKRFRIENKTV